MMIMMKVDDNHDEMMLMMIDIDDYNEEQRRRHGQWAGFGVSRKPIFKKQGAGPPNSQLARLLVLLTW